MWLIGSVFWKVRKYVFFKWLDPYLFNKKKVASVLWIWSESEHLDWNPFKKWIYTERLRLANIFRSGQTHGTSIIWKIRTCCARMKKTRSFPKKDRVWRLFWSNQMPSTNRNILSEPIPGRFSWVGSGFPDVRIHIRIRLLLGVGSGSGSTPFGSAHG